VKVVFSVEKTVGIVVAGFQRSFFREAYSRATPPQ
jgi:hypothetical protein